MTRFNYRYFAPSLDRDLAREGEEEEKESESASKYLNLELNLKRGKGIETIGSEFGHAWVLGIDDEGVLWGRRIWL